MAEKPNHLKTLSIHQAYAGRNVLIAGASGFLGKVWLAMMLDRVPTFGKIYVLLRRKGPQSARQRFEGMLNSSFVFENLHQRFGLKLAQYITKRVEVVEGDLTKPGLGLNSSQKQHIQEKLDLFVNCAGLVEFNPDLRDGISTNVQGSLNAAEFVESCNHASLLHVSTCYVAGVRQGFIRESLLTDITPKGDTFDPEKEYQECVSEINQILDEQSNPEVEQAIRERVFKRCNGNGSAQKSEKRALDMMAHWKRRYVREMLMKAGKIRANEKGWPNTYAYTKFLAEALITKRKPKYRFAIFRPSIVESSLAYPFPGWNEGFNTCGPLAHLLGSWFRYLPAKKGNPFDVIPVDLVCTGLTIAGAALLQNKHAPVYQCGTSDFNLLTIDQAAEFTSLSHRIQYRKNGKTLVERMVRSRWKAISVGDNHPLSVENVRSAIRGVNRFLDRFSSKKPKMLQTVSDLAKRTDRRLEKVDYMLDLFRPYIHDYHHIFETSALKKYHIVESEFRFAPEEFDWKTYWLDVHMPGLRRWCFPFMEGRKEETFRPEAPLRLPEIPGTDLNEPFIPPTQTNSSQLGRFK